jgi:hypothetical protein
MSHKKIESTLLVVELTNITNVPCLTDKLVSSGQAASLKKAR